MVRRHVKLIIFQFKGMEQHAGERKHLLHSVREHCLERFGRVQLGFFVVKTETSIKGLASSGWGLCKNDLEKLQSVRKRWFVSNEWRHHEVSEAVIRDC